MGRSVYRNRINPDFTMNRLETAGEVKILLKPHIDLQASTMLQTPEKHDLKLIGNLSTLQNRQQSHWFVVQFINRLF